MNEPNYISRPKFLAELRLLYEKYNLVIASCGCCRGTYIANVDAEDIGNHIEHLDKNDLRIDNPHTF